MLKNQLQLLSESAYGGGMGGGGGGMGRVVGRGGVAKRVASSAQRAPGDSRPESTSVESTPAQGEMMREIGGGGAWLPRRLSEGMNASLGAWRSWYGESAPEHSDAGTRSPAPHRSASPPQHRSVSPPSRQGVDSSYQSSSYQSSSYPWEAMGSEAIPGVGGHLLVLCVCAREHARTHTQRIHSIRPQTAASAASAAASAY